MRTFSSSASMSRLGVLLVASSPSSKVLESDPMVHLPKSRPGGGAGGVYARSRRRATIAASSLPQWPPSPPTAAWSPLPIWCPVKRRVENAQNWAKIRSCLQEDQDGKDCEKLGARKETLSQFVISNLSPIQLHYRL